MTPVPARAIAAKVGTTIDAAISLAGRQACPRKRIHATIATVIVAPIENSIIAGCWLDMLAPRAPIIQSAGMLRANMPMNIAAIISTVYNTVVATSFASASWGLTGWQLWPGSAG